MGAGRGGDVRLCGKFGRGLGIEAVQTTAADHQPRRAGRPSCSGRPGHRHSGGLRRADDADSADVRGSECAAITRGAVGLPTDLWSFLDSNFVNGFVSAGYTSPAIIQQTVTGAMADINAVSVAGQPGATALPPMGAGPGNDTWAPLLTPNVPYSSAAVPFGSTSVPGVGQGMASAGLARGVFVGRLSVPQSWAAATQVENHAGTALAGGGWTSTALPESSAGVPGMPGIPAASTAGRHFGSGPRYGFHVTVMPRPPAAG